MSLPQPSCTPTDNNVLCGRGHRCINHPGNVFLRGVVHSLKLEYNNLPNKHKNELQTCVFNKVAERGGRFLQQMPPPDPSQKAPAVLWFPLSKTKLLRKIAQHFCTELNSDRKRFREVNKQQWNTNNQKLFEKSDSIGKKGHFLSRKKHFSQIAKKSITIQLTINN